MDVLRTAASTRTSFDFLGRDCERWLSCLRNWVGISSPVHDTEGVRQQIAEVERVCRRLDLRTELIPNPGSSSADLLLANLEGSRDDQVDVTLVAHADTVLGHSGDVTQTLDWIVGSGACDNKGGLVVLLWGLEKYLTQSDAPLRIRVVISPNEEAGSQGYLQLFSELGRKTEIVLGFEPCLEDGKIIHSRRGNRWYHIRSVGREAHAGRVGNEAANAAHGLIGLLSQMIRYEDRSRDLHLNVGALSGGRDRFNIVCGSAEAKADLRFACLETRDEFHTKFLELIGQQTEGVKLSWELSDDCPPMVNDPRSGRLLSSYCKTLELWEQRAIRAVRGLGASDVNHFYRPGIVAIDGLGPEGVGMHAEGEAVRCISVQTRADALASMLWQIEQGVDL